LFPYARLGALMMLRQVKPPGSYARRVGASVECPVLPSSLVAVLQLFLGCTKPTDVAAYLVLRGLTAAEHRVE
jgi:hypothetical protein